MIQEMFELELEQDCGGLGRRKITIFGSVRELPSHCGESDLFQVEVKSATLKLISRDRKNEYTIPVLHMLDAASICTFEEALRKRYQKFGSRFQSGRGHVRLG